MQKTACLLLALLVFAGSCGKDRSSYVYNAKNPNGVTDSQGRHISLETPPVRIVSVSLTADEILLDLTGPQRLIGVSTFAGKQHISNVAEKAAEIENQVVLNSEQIIELDPDLVIAAAWSDADTLAQIESYGIPVYQHEQPVTIQAVKDLISNIGLLIHAHEQANMLIQDMDAKLGETAEFLEENAGGKKKTCLEYNQWGTAGGAGSMWNTMVTKAGLINPVASMISDKTGFVPVSNEIYIHIDPDIIVVSDTIYSNTQQHTSPGKTLSTNPSLAILKAIKNEDVIIMPEKMKTTTSHYVTESIDFLARAAYGK